MRSFIYTGKQRQLDFEEFSDGTERSTVGSLRLVRGTPVDVTDSELAALKAAGVSGWCPDQAEHDASPPETDPAVLAEARSRDEDGRFEADDPSTEENEAFKTGKKPRAKRKAKRKANPISK